MTAPMHAMDAHFDAQAHRFTDQELADLSLPPSIQLAADQVSRERLIAQRKFNLKLLKFLTEEGAAAWLEPSPHDGGTITVTDGGPRDPKEPVVLPRLAVAIEHYGRILRTLEKNIPVILKINIANKFYDDNLDSFNVIAEIPGADKAEEVVMLGAHFDSWNSGTGATDNAAGSAVMMEAMRILKASDLRTRRTIRLALWTGEEEGLLGSRAYVKEHFADRQSMHLKADHAKLSGYFNADNGTGKIRGIYLQGNDAVQPVFEKWMEPFKSMGMTALSIRGVNSTDHLSFDEVGLPGFQFIQDPIEYETRTHHTNMDVYERLQEADLKQMAVIVASFVYMTANADQQLPRKPLPKR
jgi:carboxypeptidase Q